MTKQEILKAAERQAREAYKKFRHCENRFAFQKERRLVARWNFIIARLREKDPKKYTPKRKIPLSSLVSLTLEKYFK